MALSVSASVVEHTFVVSQVNMTHLCKDTMATVVNGQLPGPAIEVTEGDSALSEAMEVPIIIGDWWLLGACLGVNRE
ncbi:laccase-15-like [Setaria viridis]|uniref:laccase-15-like n=1 Tax=Setaria viridis TaxID=4556 RepID=UPI003B3B1A2F